jgi:HAD superfamily hydrolase (TIGR01509 family)
MRDVDWTDYDAVLFDLDGVLTPTAVVHEHAWAKMFTDYFDRHGIEPPYTEADYFAYVDGKPRYDGVRSVLESRGVELPEGDPDDDPSAETVCGLGNRKNVAFNEVLAAEGVKPYEGSLALMAELEARGIAMAVVSSSKNAPAVLAAAGIADRFEVVVDGVVAAREQLKGKPSGQTYTYAASLVGSPVDRTVVVEDALSGVAAGRDGRFGLVVGVDRGAGRDALIEHGADVVVSDLAELVDR